MTITIIGSGSSGNCYILQNQKEALIIEAGTPFDKDVKNALQWNTSKIKAVIISHTHSDHAAFAPQYTDVGITVRTLQDVIDKRALNTTFAKPYIPGKWFKAGGFLILPFPLIHYNTDGTRCPICGFLIKHNDCGRICFFTDCAAFTREIMTNNGIKYIPYDFKDINLWMIEANYDNYIMYRNKLDEHIKERIRRSHMSIQKAIKIAKRIDLHLTKMILLIHISNGNGDERKFIKKMREATAKRVYAAHKGLTIDL